MRDELRTERSGSTSNPENVWSDEHICLLAALAVTALIVYGSLVPFDLRRSEALNPRSWLAQVQSTPWSRMSATDLLVNIAVGMPLGFVLMGAFRAGRRRRAAGAAVAMLAVTCFSAMLGAVLELLQVLSPTRQSSWNDVSSQTIGACVGALAWTLVGRAVIQWLRDAGNEHAPGAFAARLLQLYLPVYLLVRLTPFDSGRAVELAAKYREGGVALMPFTQSVDSTFVMLLNLAGNALLTVPIGALAVLGWGRRGTRRPVGWALLLGLSMVLAAEIAEAFVWRRHADMSELLVGTLGVMIGVAAASAFPRSHVNRVGLSRLAHSWVLMAAGVWTVVLAVHSWYPFDFEVTSEIVRERLFRISLVPFGFYYWYAIYVVNPLQAVHETLLTFVLAVPLGILLRLAWPIAGERRIRRLQTVATIGVATIVLVGIEFGQTFLPMRFPDVTDLLIGTIGAMAGIATVTAFASRVGREMYDAAPRTDASGNMTTSFSAALGETLRPWFKRLPSPVRNHVRTGLQRFPFVARLLRSNAERERPPGTVKWGSLRRTAPFSRDWGYDRGTPIDRVYIEQFLASHADDVRGACVEVMNSAYTDRFGGARVTHKDVLDIDPANTLGTIVADLGEPDSLPVQRFDCIIFTQTLHLIPDMRIALANVWRALAPGGTLLLTVPALGRHDTRKGFHHDRWRVTRTGLEWLLGGLPNARADTTTYGNVLSCTAFLYGLAAEELHPEELQISDPAFPLIVAVRAHKEHIQ